MEKQLVELADRYSRRRVGIAVLAVVVFLVVQLATWPQVFGGVTPSTRVDWWVINVLALLGVVATGGGLLNSGRVRALVQDDLARIHLRTAIGGGYWVAMGVALSLYLAPWFKSMTGRQAIYLIVTVSVAVPLLTFAILEGRAHSDETTTH